MESTSAVHRDTVVDASEGDTGWQEAMAAAVARTGGMEVLHRLSGTLGETCIRLSEHHRTATDQHEAELLDRLLSALGVTLGAIRLQRLVAQSREGRAGRMGNTERETARRWLCNAAMAEAHQAQWNVAELCYAWLVEWEDVEVRDAEQAGRLRHWIHAMSRQLEAVLVDLGGCPEPTTIR